MTTEPLAGAPAPGEPTYVEAEPDGGPRIAHFPITFFAVVMGLAGTSLAWTRSALVLGVPDWVGDALFWLALAAFVAVVGAYTAKAVLAMAAVRDELRHPIRMAFLPTISISLLLLAAAGRETAEPLAEGLWWVGVVGQLVLTLYVLTAWINRADFGMHHVTPAWFIPVVGTLVVPLAGVDFGPVELSWFFYSAGFVFWAALLPLVVTRLFVHEQPMPGKLLPTLAILVAPPAVAMVSYLRLEPDGFGAFARVLYYSALFFLLVFLAQVGRLRRLPFFLSWWAYGFPLAAITVATLVVTRALGTPAWGETLSWVLLVVTSLLVVVLAGRTAAAMVKGEVCIPE